MNQTRAPHHQIGVRLAPALFLATAACAAQEVRAPAPAAETVVVLDDHLACGARLERVALVVDGAVQFHDVLAAEHTLPRELARFLPVAGDHVLQVLFVVSAPCGLSTEPRYLLEVRSAHAFTGAPATIAIDLYSPSPADAPYGLAGVRVRESSAHLAPAPFVVDAPADGPSRRVFVVRPSYAAGCPDRGEITPIRL